MFFKSLNCLVTISGVSGTGKTTLISNLERIYGGGRVITYTTRSKRPNETENDYHFCQREEINKLPDTIWTKENYGHLYAVTRSIFLEPLEMYGIALLPTITSHQNTLRDLFPEVRYIGVHLLSPSREVLIKRMLERGDDQGQIETRLGQIDKIDKRASSNPYLHCLAPNSEGQILQTVLNLIFNTTK